MINSMVDNNSGRMYITSTESTNMPAWKMAAIVDEASKEKKPSFIALVLTTLANIF